MKENITLCCTCTWRIQRIILSHCYSLCASHYMNYNDKKLLIWLKFIKVSKMHNILNLEQSAVHVILARPLHNDQTTSTSCLPLLVLFYLQLLVWIIHRYRLLFSFRTVLLPFYNRRPVHYIYTGTKIKIKENQSMTIIVKEVPRVNTEASHHGLRIVRGFPMNAYLDLSCYILFVKVCPCAYMREKYIS